MSSIKLKHSGGNGMIIAAPSSNPAADRTISLNDTYAGNGSFVTANSSGNVGIGTASPSTLVHLNSSGDTQLTLSSDSDTFKLSCFSNGEAGIETAGAKPLRFLTNASERMRIDSSGNVGIGVTDVKGALQVNSDKNAETDRFDGSNYHLFLRNPQDDSGEACGLAFAVTSNATKTGAAIMFEREGGGSQGSLQFYTNGDGNSVTERMRIESDGDLRVQRIYDNTTSGGANVRVQSNGLLQRDTSSKRYKNTITDATHGLADLNKLRSVTYKGNNDGDTIFGGLIAEEVHDAGLTEFVDYDSDNQPDALKYGNMVSLCIKAIQELSTKVETLETEKTQMQTDLTALTARVAALEAG